MTAILKVDTIQDTSGNNIINENANTITIGKSGDTTNIVGTLQNDGAALISGITNADQWRVSATNFFSGSSGDITANWERGDTDSQGYIGSAMTQSSGVFTFPSTGIWLVMAQMSIRPDGVRQYSGGQIMVTTDNSSYNSAAEIYQHTTAGNNYLSIYFHHILDVTDTSNVKVRLRYDSDGSAHVIGSTSAHTTAMSFIRLGDT